MGAWAATGSRYADATWPTEKAKMQGVGNRSQVDHMIMLLIDMAVVIMAVVIMAVVITAVEVLGGPATACIT